MLLGYFACSQWIAMINSKTQVVYWNEDDDEYGLTASILYYR